MYKNLLAAAAVSVAGVAGSVQAAPVTLNLDLFAILDNAVGNGFAGTSIGTADITYEETDIVGTGELFATSQTIPGFPPNPTFDFVINAFGQTFDDNDDSDAVLGYTDGAVTSFRVAILENSLTSPVPIDDPRVVSFFSFPLGVIDYSGTPASITVGVNDVAAPIPLPAGAVLLLSGLAGFAAAKRRMA